MYELMYRSIHLASITTHYCICATKNVWLKVYVFKSARNRRKGCLLCRVCKYKCTVLMRRLRYFFYLFLCACTSSWVIFPSAIRHPFESIIKLCVRTVPQVMPVTELEFRIFFDHPKLITPYELTLRSTPKRLTYLVRNTTLESGNDCYHSVQKILPSSLLFKHIKIKIFSTIIFPVVLCWCETWSLTRNIEGER
jgi:hypothetical protein